MDGIENLTVSVTVVHSARGFLGFGVGWVYLESFLLFTASGGSRNIRRCGKWGYFFDAISCTSRTHTDFSGCHLQHLFDSFNGARYTARHKLNHISTLA